MTSSDFLLKFILDAVWRRWLGVSCSNPGKGCWHLAEGDWWEGEQSHLYDERQAQQLLLMCGCGSEKK